MSAEWLLDSLRTLAIGAVGGLSGYWLAGRRFLSDRLWERRYELYSEIFCALNDVEHSLVVFEHIVDCDHARRSGPEAQAAAATYESGLLRVSQLQERLLLLGADEAHVRLMVLYASFRFFEPAMVIGPSDLSANDREELRDLVKACRRDAAGRNGEFAFLARENLGLKPTRFARWWKRRRTLARMQRWTETFPKPPADKADALPVESKGVV